MNRRPCWALLAVLAATAALGAACGGGSESSGASDETVVTIRKTGNGALLVDGSNHTLYTFSKGVDCTGECAEEWPPLRAEGQVAADTQSGLDQTLFGTMKRGDGTFQVTYDGQPLYLFTEEDAGELRGEGSDDFGGSWESVLLPNEQLKPQKTGGDSCEPNCGY